MDGWVDIIFTQTRTERKTEIRVIGIVKDAQIRSMHYFKSRKVVVIGK